MDHATIARGRRPADSDNAPFRNEQPKGGDAVGQFGHHPDASTDFCCEIETLEGWVQDVRAGTRSQWPFWGRLSRLLKFVRSDEAKALDKIAQRAIPRVEAMRHWGPDELHAAPSPATSPGPQDVRGALKHLCAVLGDPEEQSSCACFPNPDGLVAALERAKAALARSDAQPVGWRNLAKFTDAIRVRNKLAVHFRNEGEAQAALVALTTPPSLPEGAREALEKAARLLLDAETICHAVSNRGQPTYHNMAEAFKQAREQCRAALSATSTPSSAGLIEAAEWHDAEAARLEEERRYWSTGTESYSALIEVHNNAAKHFRASAADKSATQDIHDTRRVTFWYRNYRGESSWRTAIVLGLRWGSSEYHKEPQWLLRAFDVDKKAEREFAVKDMLPENTAS